MNDNNLDWLKNGLVEMGFGDKLHKQMEEKISRKLPEFKLDFTKDFGPEGNKQMVDFTLDFRKSEQSDKYFFNRYRATMNFDDHPLEVAQTFYVNKNQGITTDEAHNLLNGRAVNKDLYTKEGKQYNAWVQLDFQQKDKHDNHLVKQFSAGYGYDLVKTLQKHPIQELNDASKATEIVKSLKTGNTTPVTFLKEGKEEKMFIEANPQFKTLNIYDGSMKKIFQENAKKEGQSPREPEKKQDKTEKKDADEGDRTQKSFRKRTVKR